MKNINKKDTAYYARIIPNAGIYEVCELIIRTVEDSFFVGIDKRDKHAYLFSYEDIDNIVFISKKDALIRVKECEENKREISNETYYEEY